MPVVPGICTAPGGGGSDECQCFHHDDECLQDNNGIFWRRVQTAPDGTVTVSYVDNAGAAYVPVGTIRACDVAEIDIDVQKQLLCDDTLNDGTAIVEFERHWTYEGGVLTGTYDTDLNGDPYTVLGTVQACQPVPECCPITLDQGCWDDGVTTGTWVSIQQSDGTVVVIDPTTGDPVAPGDVVPCPQTKRTVQKQLLCDEAGPDCEDRVRFERHWLYDCDGNLTGTYDTDLDGNPYVVVGAVVDCDAPCDCCPTIIAEGCYPDENGDTRQWITIYDQNTQTATTFDPANGQPVDPNLMGECPDPIRQVQKQLLCDDDGNGTTQFERHFEYDSAGLFMGTTDTDLDGNPYTVVGTVVSCQDERHIVQSELLCDESGSQFERHFVYSNLGALLSTFDTDLDGNPYAVFGDVIPCTSIIDDAEWVTIGEGCWDDGGGNSGRYTAIRDQNDGSVILVDSVTGVQLSPLLIVDCEKCCITAIADGCWDDGAGNTGTWVSLYDDDTSTATLIDPVTGDPVDPDDVVECPEGFTEETTLATASASTVNVPTGNLTGWEVRHISGTVDLTVNGDTVTMQSGEVIGASAQDGDLLDDTVVVDASAGEARVIYKVRT